jgi:hypothetical protein
MNTMPLHPLYIESPHFNLFWHTSSKLSCVWLVLSLTTGLGVSPPLQSVAVTCNYGLPQTMMPMILGCRSYLLSPHFPRGCRNGSLGRQKDGWAPVDTGPVGYEFVHIFG